MDFIGTERSIDFLHRRLDKLEQRRLFSLKNLFGINMKKLLCAVLQ